MDKNEHEMKIFELEQLRAGIKYQQVNQQGQAAIKSALLINGGASVAMLALIGTLIDKQVERVLITKLCLSLGMFVAGTLIVAIACGGTYLCGMLQSRVKIWWVLNIIVIIMVIFGYVLFGWSSRNAYCAFMG
ncbi:MAG: hypothetical protein JW849_01210 [Phycisphaerae bacterium]|nr:hypothetical protein [Phycisphaerae bacterium]